MGLSRRGHRGAAGGVAVDDSRPAGAGQDKESQEGKESEAAWLASYFASVPSREAFEVIDGRGVPIELVDEYFCRDLFDDPEARRLHLVADTWSRSVGRFEDPGLLVNIAPGGGVVQRGPCACGEHTREILVELGYDDVEVANLFENRTVLEPATDPA